MPTCNVWRRGAAFKVAFCATVLIATQSCGESTALDPFPVAFVPDGRRDRYYRLQTAESSQVTGCLEGNRFVPTATLSGAAFMDGCQDVTGQSWRFVPMGDGLYRMQTLFLEAEDKCLESNILGASSLLHGAAHMDDCGDSPGQLWSVVPLREGAFSLQTVSGGPGKCFNGNRPASGAVARGGAFMADCTGEWGEIWFATVR